MSDSEQSTDLERRLADVLRPELAKMSAYRVADAAGLIKLDAMENPFGLPPELAEPLAKQLSTLALNRYPKPRPAALLEKLRATQGLPEGVDLSLGNGSDELIHLLIQMVAKPGAVVMAPTPGFVMYEVSTRLNGLRFCPVPLKADFSMDVPAMLAAIARDRPALIFLAHPNNPTGNCFARSDLEAVIAAAPGLVVVDEAYRPFADPGPDASLASWVDRYPQIVVSRTLSKFGLAGIRLGYCFGDSRWINELEKVRPPYNTNVLTQTVAEFALDHADIFERQAALIRSERQRLTEALAQLNGCVPFPSQANFVLVQVPDAQSGFAALRNAGILIKNLHGTHPLLNQCLRLTVGTPQDNQAMLAALRNHFGLIR